MTVEYLHMYKWENLEDGTKEKFLYKLEALPWELSLQTKLGCADMLMEIYIPESQYNREMKKRCQLGKEKYKLRQQKLAELLELIKNNVEFDKKIGNEYLYELWISRIFGLDWREQNKQKDPLDDIQILYNELLLNNNVNPFDIDLTKNIHNIKKQKTLRKIFNIFKKN